MSRSSTHPSPPTIFVLILSHKQRDTTLACLSDLLAGGDIPFKVLVLDNGSQDDTLAAIRKKYPGVLTQASGYNLGVAGGRNALAQIAIAEYRATHLLFLDNDIFVEPGFVGALYRPFESDPQLGQTQAKLRFWHDRHVINDAGGSRINFVLWKVTPVGYGEPDQGQYDTPHACISCGGAMMVRSHIFQQLNGFDLRFSPYGPEDLDFSLRLKEQGYKALYIPQAVGYHQGNHTFGAGYTEEYARHKSRHWLLFMQRHAKPWEKIAFYLFGAPLLTVQVFLREARRGNLRAFRGLMQGLLQPKNRDL